MSPEAAILLVIGLFLLGVVSPGPNFLVVVEHGMATGFRGGLSTGLGSRPAMHCTPPPACSACSAWRR